jgi:hypothetical protein
MKKTQLGSASPLSRPRQEAYAQGLSRGEAPRKAAIAAGYRTLRYAEGLVGQPEIAARVAILKAAWDGGGSADTGALIDELIAIGRQARDLADTRGLAIARACLVDAARLKLRRDPDPPLGVAAPMAAEPDGVLAELDRDLSDEEWTRRFGPEAPGGGVVGGAA